MEDPWDDSVLISAFNSAISKYKKKNIHGIPGKSASKKKLVDVTEGANADKALRSESDFTETDDQQLRVEKGLCTISPRAFKGDNEMASIETAENANQYATEGPANWVDYERQQIEQQLCQLRCQRESLKQRLTQLGNSSMEAKAACCSYTGIDSRAQHSYALDCYHCQWNAYYNARGDSTSSANFWTDQLQCQHCGFANKCKESPREVTEPLLQIFQDVLVSREYNDPSTLPEIVRKTVVDVLKVTDVKDSAKHTNLPDVVAAWFLAGFQTSRYLSGKGECQPDPAGQQPGSDPKHMET